MQKNPLPAESFLYEKRMRQTLVTAYVYPAAKFLSVYASKYTSASFTVPPSSIVLSSCKRKDAKHCPHFSTSSVFLCPYNPAEYLCHS